MSISVVGSGIAVASNSPSLALPAGIVDGDLLLVFVVYNATGDDFAVDQPSMTLLRAVPYNASGNESFATKLYGKIYNSSTDSSPLTTTGTAAGSNRRIVIALALRGAALSGILVGDTEGYYPSELAWPAVSYSGLRHVFRFWAAGQTVSAPGSLTELEFGGTTVNADVWGGLWQDANPVEGGAPEISPTIARTVGMAYTVAISEPPPGLGRLSRQPDRTWDGSNQGGFSDPYLARF